MGILHYFPPTLARGIARSAGESAYPNLWKGLLGLWAPHVGHQGITTLKDFSGFGRHGTLTGSMDNADWVVHHRGHALDLDGTDDGVNLPNVPELTPTNALSIVVWYRHDVSTTQPLVQRFAAGADTVDPYMLQSRATGANLFVRFALDTGAVTNVDSGGNQNNLVNWKLAAGTYDGATQMAYHGHQGGLFFASAAKTGSMTENTGNVSIGRSNTVFFNGMVSFAAIYDRALTHSEIQQYWRGASPLARRRFILGKTPAVAPGGTKGGLALMGMGA
jgi:hypothetical protein